jgi:hypothetical protein
MRPGARELPASFHVFVPLGIAISAEYFPASHVIVPVAASVRIILERGLLGLIHVTPPAFGVVGPDRNLGS